MVRSESESGTMSPNSIHRQSPYLDSAPVLGGSRQCSVCKSTFRRAEHLKRHLRSHTKEKPFQCSQCSRKFSRSDTLHRHELSHCFTGTDGRSDKLHRITMKTFRACYNCAIARVRCSGGDACSRCRNRDLECKYPVERRAKGKMNKHTSKNASSTPTSQSQIDQIDPRLRSPQDERLNGQIRAFCVDNPRQQQSPRRPSCPQLQFVGYHAPSYQSEGRSPHTTPSSADSHYIGQSSEQTNTSEPMYTETVLPAGIHQLDEFSYPTLGNINNQQTSADNDSEPDFSISLRGDTSHATHSAVEAASMAAQPVNPHMDGPNQNHESLSSRVGQNLFNQTEELALNWLSPDFLAAENDHMAAQAFALPLSNGIWSPNFESSNMWLPNTTRIGQLQTYNLSHPRNVSPRELDVLHSVVSPSHQTPTVVESPPPSLEGSVRSGEFYVDGDGARLPKYSRKRRTWSSSAASQPHILYQARFNDQEPSFSFSPVENIHNYSLSSDIWNRVEISHSTYEQLRNNFVRLCRIDNPLFIKFDTDHFPSIEEVNCFVGHYFDSFNTVYPLLHPATFNPNNTPWILTLAICTVGSHMASLQGSGGITKGFREFLRRAIIVEKEKYANEATPLWLLQGMFLSCVCLLHSSGHWQISGIEMFGDMIRTSHRGKTISSAEALISSSRIPERNNTWEEWVDDEIRRRTGYCIWLLDCTLSYQFDMRRRLRLNDAQAPLPCHESLWDAPTAELWKERNKSSAETVSLYKATEILYVEKRLVDGIGEFSHVLLVHALYQRTWEVSEYYHTPLSWWIPTAEKQSRDSVLPSGTVWLPGIPEYSRWRNSACDCLDTLHWTANGTIARAAGLEHPTVLHLHLARVVLLSPFREIRNLATSLAGQVITWDEHEQAAEWYHICRWVKHDQYKARLSLIHSGCVLWHVRRYPSSAFHEPVAVFLAILTLWAYGLCHKASETGEDSVFQGQRDRTDPTFIHLDRPCDDELVQLYVREGQRMRGNVTGVGDVCGPFGPQRLLKEGIRSLSELTSWGITQELIAILNRLDETIPSPVSSADRP